MIDVGLAPPDVFYRFHSPKWASQPLSGAGAAIGGGRFNRPGVEALYLARAPQTALEEYRQGSTILKPATVTSYSVTLGLVADLSAGYDPASWALPWSDWDCNWRHIARIERKTPASWLLADELIRNGYQGLLFPSVLHPGGTNLVVFSANMVKPDRLEVHDPDGQLPRDLSSWLPKP